MHEILLQPITVTLIANSALMCTSLQQVTGWAELDSFHSAFNVDPHGADTGYSLLIATVLSFIIMRQNCTYSCDNKSRSSQRPPCGARRFLLQEREMERLLAESVRMLE